MTALKEEVMRCLAAVQDAPITGGPELRRAVAAERPRVPTERVVTFRVQPWMVAVTGVAFIAIVSVAVATRRPRPAREVASAEAPLRAPIAVETPQPPQPPAPAAPVIVPVEGSPPPAQPPHEPVALKRPARVVETPPRGATPPALAAPWPVESPQVFPQPPAAAKPSGAKRAAVVEAAPGKPAEKAVTPEKPAADQKAPPAPTAAEILARGQTAFDRGNYPEAIRRAKEAVAAGAAVAGHLLVADAYYHLQRYADALREYEATLAVEPSNALARRGRELAQRAANNEATR